MDYKKRFKTIKNLILQYEKGDKRQFETIESINKIAITKIDEYCLNHYWRADNIDTTVRVLSIDMIDNWEDIDDNDALKLIQEILDNLGDDGILHRNSEALEKRFKKSSGTVIDLIFHSNKGTKEKVLNELKKDTVIRL